VPEDQDVLPIDMHIVFLTVLSLCMHSDGGILSSNPKCDRLLTC